MGSVSVYLLLVVAILGGAVFILFVRPARRRKKLALENLPAHWQDWIADAVPHYVRYPEDLRRQLDVRVNIFLAEKTFYGCGGLVIDDRQRVTIAAQACLLIINRSIDDFSTMRAILLYPSAFRVPPSYGIDSDGLVPEHDEVHLGESWEEGRIILSWDDIERAIVQRQAGQLPDTNVVIHEFAHQLDQLEGISATIDEEATTQLAPNVLTEAYGALQQAVENDEQTLLDPYAATEPAEFVAVAAEVFFEHPVGLYEDEPGLYCVLSRLFRVDPASWFGGETVTKARGRRTSNRSGEPGDR